MPASFNKYLDCELQPNGRFRITFTAPGYSPITNLGVQVRLHQGKEPVTLTEPVAVQVVDGLDAPIPAGLPDHQVSLWVQVAVLPDSPLFHWRAGIVNQTEQVLTVDRIDLLNLASEESRLDGLGLPCPVAVGSFYSNAFSSWAYTGSYPLDGQMRKTHLGGLQAAHLFNTSTPQPTRRGEFSADMYGVVFDRTSRKGMLAGFLSQQETFGSISMVTRKGNTNLHMWANGDGVQLYPGGRFITDWAVLLPVDGPQPFPMDEYVQAVADFHGISTPRPAPDGWCSWYMFYTKVTADQVRDNLRSIQASDASLPLDLVQIDDGFETQVGDWFSFLPTFPDGVAPLAREIKAAGKIPGLWLAPFIVSPKSQLWKTRPDWLIKDKHGRPASAGYNWERINGGLDLTVPEALDYACDVVRTASQEWGFPYLKLDFLFAGALSGVYADPTVTRAQALRRAMQAIRRAVGPQTYLLGCGAPMGSVLGLVDSMRIGADVSGSWYPKFNGVSAIIRNEPHFPSAVNAIHNVVTRAHLHRKWWINDPDCLLVRDDTDLTLAEVQTLTTVIALTGGAYLLSDDLPRLSVERRQMAEVCLPLIGERAQVVDLFDEERPSILRLPVHTVNENWMLEAHINWEDKPVTTVLTAPEGEGEVWMRSFWTGQVGRMMPGTKMPMRVPPHGVCLMAIRQAKPNEPVYIGSDLHISQGMEVASFVADESSIEVMLSLPRTCSGEMVISTVKPVSEVLVEGKPTDWRDLGAGMAAVSIKDCHQSLVRLRYK